MATRKSNQILRAVLLALSLSLILIQFSSCAIYQLVQSEEKSPEEAKQTDLVVYPVYDAGVEAIPLDEAEATGGMVVGNPTKPDFGTGGFDVGNPGRANQGTGGTVVGNPTQPNQGTGGTVVGNPGQPDHATSGVDVGNPRLQQFERSLFGGIDVGNPLWRSMLTFAPESTLLAKYVSTSPVETTLAQLNDAKSNLFVLLTVTGAYPKNLGQLVVEAEQCALVASTDGGIALNLSDPHVVATALLEGKTALLAKGKVTASEYSGLRLSLGSGRLSISGKPFAFVRGTTSLLKGLLPLHEIETKSYVFVLALSLNDSFTQTGERTLFQPAFSLRSVLQKDQGDFNLIYTALRVDPDTNAGEEQQPKPTGEPTEDESTPASVEQPSGIFILPGWDLDKAQAYCNSEARKQDVDECMRCTRTCDIKAVWDANGKCFLSTGQEVDSANKCAPL